MKHNISNNLKSSNSQSVNIAVTITLYVGKCDCLMRVVLGLLKNIAVPVLSGTSFIERFVKGIYLSEWKIFMYNSDSVALLLMIKEDGKEEGSEEANSVMMLEIEDEKNQLNRRFPRTSILCFYSECI